MPVLLHLDSSPMGEESVSRRLTSEFAHLWREVNPRGDVIYRDIATINIPVVDAEWVAANYTPVELRTPEQHRVLALSAEFAQELLDADEYVLGVPIHNWGPSSSFKLWADQVIHFGKTVQVTASGLKGVLGGKRLTIFISAGRRFRHGFEDPSRNHLEPWLKTFFGNLGIRDMHLVMVDGTGAIRRGKIDTATFLAPHVQSVRSLVAGGVSWQIAGRPAQFELIPNKVDF
jgi:FMN-dependent NADH-azoreductase